MKIISKSTRWVAGLLLAATVLASTAALAEAGHWRDRHFRGPVCAPRMAHRGYDVYYARRGSGAGPALAGFFGGLVLGAVLAEGIHDREIYRDPYCHEDFASLEIYSSHCRAHHHARVYRVIEVGGNGCGDRYQEVDWDDGDRYYGEDDN